MRLGIIEILTVLFFIVGLPLGTLYFMDKYPEQAQQIKNKTISIIDSLKNNYHK